MSQPSEAELKVTLFKILEIAYRNDENLTASIMRSQHPFTLIITSNGTATLSGKTGKLIYSVSKETQSIGFDFKFASFQFFGAQNGLLRYGASITIGFTSITFRGSLDVEKFIFECSGLVCIAARLLKDRKKQIDEAIHKSMR